jgi:hypothetical protein
LQYFADVAANQVQLGDRIILCMAKEVESGRKNEEIHSDRDVEYLDREIIQPSGGQLLLYLQSGKHHYARYEEEDGTRQHIASGGGAFLHPTHTLPERMNFPGSRKNHRLPQGRLSVTGCIETAAEANLATSSL